MREFFGFSVCLMRDLHRGAVLVCGLDDSLQDGGIVNGLFGR